MWAICCLETARANAYKVCAYVFYAQLVLFFIVLVRKVDDFVWLGDFRGFVVVIAPSIGDFIDRDSL